MNEEALDQTSGFHSLLITHYFSPKGLVIYLNKKVCLSSFLQLDAEINNYSTINAQEIKKLGHRYLKIAQQILPVF